MGCGAMYNRGTDFLVDATFFGLKNIGDCVGSHIVSIDTTPPPLVILQYLKGKNGGEWFLLKYCLSLTSFLDVLVKISF
jgi:hypothetical protein